MTARPRDPATARPARRLDGIEISLIRQINALASSQSINLGIGEPNVEPDEMLRAMAERVAARGSWHYSANAGFLSLRQKIVERTDFDPKSEVCVTAGTEEALYAIFQAYVDAGDEVLVPDPGFASYPTLAKLAGGIPVGYRLEPPEWRLEPDAVLSKITPRTRLIVVNSPSNPLGSVIDPHTLRAIAAAGPLVVSDEIYSEIWFDAPPASMLGMGRNVIVVNGMSKSHSMTGLRLGWIMAREEVIKPVITAHQYVATCASVFSQQLAELILSDADWNRSWLESVRAQFRRQREAVLDSIEHELDAKIVAPRGAFYAFVPVSYCDSVSFAKALALDAGVLVVPGAAFGTMGEGCVRISFAAPIDQIGLGVERMGRYMREANR